MSIRSEVVLLLDPLFDGRVASDSLPRGGLAFPYASVFDGVTENPAIKGDRKALAWRRTFQVDVFETLAGEDALLMEMVLAVLDGARVGGMHVSVVGSTRLTEPEPGAGTVHHAVTCSVPRPRSD